MFLIINVFEVNEKTSALFILRIKFSYNHSIVTIISYLLSSRDYQTTLNWFIQLVLLMTEKE